MNHYSSLTDDELINRALSNAVMFFDWIRKGGKALNLNADEQECKDVANAYVALLQRRLSATPSEPATPTVEPFIYQDPKTAQNRSEGGEDSTPQYNHDCPLCTFLGTFHQYDLYHCLQITNSPTIVARYGNNPEDYMSGIHTQIGPTCLHEGLSRAKQRNLRCTTQNRCHHSQTTKITTGD